MELIERYIYAIERRLPAAGRDDIAKEIQSIIMDELEGKYGAKAAYSKEEVEAILLEMGHPRKVAARYRGEKEYLIGPDLYYFYQMVLWIVIGASTLGLIISYIVGQFNTVDSGAVALKNFIDFLPSIFTSVLTSVGSVTLVFMLIERCSSPEKKKETDITQGWKPKDLPEIPRESEKVSMAESIVGMVFMIIWAVFINAYANSGGMGFLTDFSDHITVYSILNLEMVRQLLPLWNLQISIALVTQTILLFRGSWRLGTRLMDIIADLIGIAILAAIISGPMLISTDTISTIAGYGIDAAGFEHGYYVVFKVIFGLTILSIVVKTIKMIVKQAQRTDV